MKLYKKEEKRWISGNLVFLDKRIVTHIVFQDSLKQADASGGHLTY